MGQGRPFDHRENIMNLYREATSPELAEYALGWTGVNPQTRRLLFALAKRLGQEYQRAQLHMNKALDCQRLRIEQEHRLASHIKVAKPHIQLVSTTPQLRGMWRCTGSFGIVQYGSTPSEAYAAWRRVMERGHGIPRQPTACFPERANVNGRWADAMPGPASQAGTGRFRMNYMRRD